MHLLLLPLFDSIIAEYRRLQ